MKPSLSVVVLCYKAGESITPFVGQMISAIEQAHVNFELVLVGNYNRGDTEDSTPRVVRALAAADPRVKAVTLEKQGWMGWDARSGMGAANGEVIVLIDGDNQMPPEDVAQVYARMQDSRADIVTTYRVTRGDGIYRRIQSYGYNLIFRVLFPGIAARDVNSKPKLIRRELFDKFTLISDDWFIDAEIMIQARRYRAHIEEIPTVFLPVVGRRSFVKLSAVWEFVANLTRARIREFFIRP